MYKILVAITLFVAIATAQVSNEYLPPVQDVSYGGSVGGGAIQYEQPGSIGQSYEAPASFEAEPAHSYSQDEGYRYKTAKRRVFRNRRVYRQRRRY